MYGKTCLNFVVERTPHIWKNPLIHKLSWGLGNWFEVVIRSKLLWSSPDRRLCWYPEILVALGESIFSCLYNACSGTKLESRADLNPSSPPIALSSWRLASGSQRNTFVACEAVFRSEPFELGSSFRIFFGRGENFRTVHLAALKVFKRLISFLLIVHDNHTHVKLTPATTSDNINPRSDGISSRKPTTA